jgi:ferrous iron transport protein A
METTSHSITHVREGNLATVMALQGGHTFQERLRSLGVKEGKTLLMVAKHPFAGPLVVEVDGRQITIGRRMAQRILVGPAAP